MLRVMFELVELAADVIRTQTQYNGELRLDPLEPRGFLGGSFALRLEGARGSRGLPVDAGQLRLDPLEPRGLLGEPFALRLEGTCGSRGLPVRAGQVRLDSCLGVCNV